MERSRLEAFTNEDSLWHEFEKTRPPSRRQAQQTREVVRQVIELMRTELTQRQQEVVQLYYFAGLTEEKIGRRLGIPQQVVSQHLHGIRRGGKRVGGPYPSSKSSARSGVLPGECACGIVY